MKQTGIKNDPKALKNLYINILATHFEIIKQFTFAFIAGLKRKDLSDAILTTKETIVKPVFIMNSDKCFS